MSTVDAMVSYLQGEKIEALVFLLPVGVLSLVFGGWLLTDDADGFARGLSIPCVVMGLVLTIVGATVGYRTPSQVRTLRAAFAESTEVATRDEVARMAKVNGAWGIYLSAWATFGVVGLALRFGTRGEFLHGLGVGLVLFAGVGLVVDGFAERRAKVYTAALDAQRAAHEPP